MEHKDDKRLLSIIILITIVLAIVVIALNWDRVTGKKNTSSEATKEEQTNETGTSAEAETYTAPKQLVYNYISAKGKNESEQAQQALEAMQEADNTMAKSWMAIDPYWDQIASMTQTNLEITKGLPEDDSLCFVILGYALEPDGAMQPELIARLELALGLSKAYPNAYLLVTGGPTASAMRMATEAEQMGAWLVDQGVDASRIIIENQSLTTVENALFSYKLLQESYPGIHHIVIASSEYHVPLGMLLFESLFLLEGEESLQVIDGVGCTWEGKTYFPLSSQANWLWTLAYNLMDS